MVSYYNHPLTMYQKGSNLSYSPSTPWYPNYHPSNSQFLPNGESSPQQVYYSHVFHQPSPDWITHENYSPSSQNNYLQPSFNLMNHHHGILEHNNEAIQSIPSPPITVSGSEISSPCIPASSSSPQTPARPAATKSPYEWMKKSSYQPNPGKTRTKDKYRVVYSDLQRLELEKEFHYTRYITIRRKSELAQNLQLSERQVKIWFQNRRAKDRKQKKKMDVPSNNSLTNQTPAMSKLLDPHPKLDSMHLHLHHQISSGFPHNLHSHHN
ncbi:homeotic protein caudal [Culicoides brevitarsis]|uniref:homeotic protein caudal n=1 Tax=Culicoides brevitarsis TaxID=469753 RepID=UPI00307C04FD